MSKWIDWEDETTHGPFPGLHRIVEVKLRCGQIHKDNSSTFDWCWGPIEGLDIIAYRLINQEPLYDHTIKETSSGLKLIAGKGYQPDLQNKSLARLKDTGNGYIFKIPGFTSTQQDNYICVDYSEAEYIYQLLKYRFENKGELL